MKPIVIKKEDAMTNNIEGIISRRNSEGKGNLALTSVMAGVVDGVPTNRLFAKLSSLREFLLSTSLSSLSFEERIFGSLGKSDDDDDFLGVTWHPHLAQNFCESLIAAPQFLQNI